MNRQHTRTPEAGTSGFMTAFYLCGIGKFSLVPLSYGAITTTAMRRRQDTIIDQFEQSRCLKAPVRGTGYGITKRTHQFLGSLFGRDAAEHFDVRVGLVHRCFICPAIA